MTSKTPEPDQDPEGWSRFERAVDAALHTPAKHRTKDVAESSLPEKTKAKDPRS